MKINEKDKHLYIPYPEHFWGVSYKPKPKYYSLVKGKDGWSKVKYYLDKVVNSGDYSEKDLEMVGY